MNSGTSVLDEFGSRYTVTGLYIQKFYPMSEKFFFSLTGSVGYLFGTKFDKRTDTTNGSVITSDQDATILAVGLVPSFSFFPSPRWSFNGSIGHIQYTYEKTKSDANDKWEIRYGTISLGLSYYFRKG